MAWVTGFDVSHWQPPSMQLARQRVAAGDRFAIVKSTDGTATDKASAAHLDNFAAVGLACGAYIFYRSGKDPAAQARHLLDATAGRKLPFGLWLDYEDGSGADNPDDLLTFLTIVDEGFDGTVGIYTGPSWWTATIGDRRDFARFPLWLARYPKAYRDGTVPPEGTSTKTPLPWATWSVWQYSDSAGHLDRNVCTTTVFDAITHQPEDDMTPAQEAKIDALNDKLDEALPILRKLDVDYLTKGKGVRQVIVHDEKLDEEQAHHDRAADTALGR